MEMPASKLVLIYLHCSKTKTFFIPDFILILIEIVMGTLVV